MWQTYRDPFNLISGTDHYRILKRCIKRNFYFLPNITVSLYCKNKSISREKKKSVIKNDSVFNDFCAKKFIMQNSLMSQTIPFSTHHHAYIESLLWFIQLFALIFEKQFLIIFSSQSLQLYTVSSLTQHLETRKNKINI